MSASIWILEISVKYLRKSLEKLIMVLSSLIESGFATEHTENTGNGSALLFFCDLCVNMDITYAHF